MLKVKLVCVGKIREKFFSDACGEYGKRLGRFCRFELVEVPECTLGHEPSAGERLRILETEGDAILKQVSGKFVLFDVAGGKLSSEGFSRKLKEFSDGGAEISLAIGGSYGLSERVKSRADLRLSFSEMTFPHMLFRVMALEQIYRAFMIAAGSDYHK